MKMIRKTTNSNLIRISMISSDKNDSYKEITGKLSAKVVKYRKVRQTGTITSKYGTEINEGRISRT